MCHRRKKVAEHCFKNTTLIFPYTYIRIYISALYCNDIFTLASVSCMSIGKLRQTRMERMLRLFSSGYSHSTSFPHFRSSSVRYIHSDHAWVSTASYLER